MSETSPSIQSETITPAVKKPVSNDADMYKVLNQQGMARVEMAKQEQDKKAQQGQGDKNQLSEHIEHIPVNGTPHEMLQALASGVNGKDITQEEKPIDEFKTVARPTLTDALVFMRRIGAIPKFNTLPQALTQRVESIISSWDANLQTNKSVSSLMRDVSRQIDQANEQELFDEADANTLKLKSTVRKNPPLLYPIQATYTSNDLQERFPEGHTIQQQLGVDAKINVFIHTSTDTSGLMYTVEHADGKKQALRIVDSDRSFDEVSQDISQLPDVIPSTQVLQLNNGRIAILTDWVEGRTPSTQEDMNLCKNAVDGLQTIPWEQVNPNTPYDLNRTNLRITNGQDNTPRVYYIDGDLAEIVVKQGLSSDVPQARIALLERGKEKI